MKIQTTRERLLASTMICGVMALAGASPVLAQNVGAPAHPEAPAANAEQEVIVTGSRIPTPNLKSISPVQVVTSTELKLQGTTNVENLLNTLPQVYTNQSGGATNGASGTATVNLRNLGPQRTLVLVDGTRLPPADVAVPAPDLDTIPAALVDRIEVLTGGDSAVYGSDAVAGVVNFIMKHDLEGVRIDAQFGFAQHDQQNPGGIQTLERNANDAVPGNLIDGYTKDITLALGINSPDGKGNVEAYVGYRSIDAVLESTRDFSACAILVSNVTDKHLCEGSGGTTQQGEFTRVDIPGQKTHSGTPTGLSAPGVTGPQFNFAPQNYLQRPEERYSGGYFAHYEVNPHLDIYSNMMFSDNRTFAQIAPSGLFSGVTYKVNCNNPFLVAATGGVGGSQTLCAGLAPTDDTSLFIGRRTVELGNRTDDLEHTAYRLNFGFRGDIADGWSYDAYAQYADTIYQERYTGEVSIAKAQEALLAGGTTANPVCLGGQPGCVPINIFTSGSLTPAAANFISGTGEKEGSATEQIVSVSINGDLGRYGLKSPFADHGVGVAFGGEYRREAIDLSPDQEFVTGDLAGQGGQTAPVHGAYDVKEAFFEVRIPLAEHQPFFDDLSLDGGYRYSDYSSVGGTNTYKIGGEWAPVPDIRFRASYNTAVRAPNTVELFSAPAFKLFGFNDPCAGAKPTASLAACTAQGVEAPIGATGAGANGKTAYGSVIQCPASQCTNLTSGNPGLGPETSNTISYGVVFTPTFFKGFTASIDYFNIDVENLIGSFGAATIVNKCVSSFGTASGDFFCGLIHRDPVTNVIFGGSVITNEGNLATMAGNGSVNNFNTNTGYLKTDGLDIAADYRTRFSDWNLGEWGTLDFNFAGTYTFNFIDEPDSRIGHFNCAGLYGATCGAAVANGFDGGPIPVWRHKFRLTWGTPWDNLSLSIQWRYISAVKPDVSSSNPLLHTACAIGTPPASCNFGFNGNDPTDNIPAFNYIDLGAIWRVRDGITLRAGVNNVTDKDPPVVDQLNLALSSPPVGNGNTFPGVYDVLGRTFFIGITADF
jgi:iron complex outermembrane receptor protein